MRYFLSICFTLIFSCSVSDFPVVNDTNKFKLRTLVYKEFLEDVSSSQEMIVFVVDSDYEMLLKENIISKGSFFRPISEILDSNHHPRHPYDGVVYKSKADGKNGVVITINQIQRVSSKIHKVKVSSSYDSVNATQWIFLIESEKGIFSVKKKVVAVS